jgi:hypothetical protein
MSTRLKVLLLILIVVVGAGLFYLRGLSNRLGVQPAPRSEEAARARLKEASLQSSKGTSQTATLYFPSLSEGVLVPETRSMTWAETNVDRIRQVVLALVEGSHQGLERALPASTSVRAVFLTPEGTAYIDLSSEFSTELTPGIETETLTIYSLVNSISKNIPSVKRVKIIIQGQEVETLDGHADLTAAYVPDPTRIKSGP